MVLWVGEDQGGFEGGDAVLQFGCSPNPDAVGAGHAAHRYRIWGGILVMGRPLDGGKGGQAAKP